MQLARIRAWEAAGLMLIVIAGLIVRSWQLGFSFGSDEISSILIAKDGFAQFLAGALHDAPHPPLYYFSLWVWLSLFGVSEAAARAFSIVCSAGFLVVVYPLLRRYLESWLALGVLLIFAFGSYFVFYGQQARPYSLIAFLAALNLLAFFRALDEPDRRSTTLWWGLSVVAFVYSQYMAVMVVGLEIAYALFRLNRAGLRIALYGALATLTLVPWIIAAMGAAFAQHRSAIPTTGWITRPTPEDVAWFYATLVGTAVQLRWLFLTLGGLALLYIWRAYKSRAWPPEHLFMAVLAVAVPAVVYVMSVWGPKPLFLARQFMPAAIASVVFVGILLGAAPRGLAALAVAGLVAIAVLSLSEALPHAKNEPWREVAAYLDREGGAGWVIISDRQERSALTYYAPRLHAVPSAGALPSGAAAGWVVCRPYRCNRTGFGGLALVKTWQWGIDKGSGTITRILLYRVEARAARS